MDKHFFNFFTIENRFNIDTDDMRRSRVNPDSVLHELEPGADVFASDDACARLAT